MFLRSLKLPNFPPGVSAMSMGFQIFLITTMAFIMVTLVDYFYLTMIRNEITRNQKDAAIYAISRGRDFTARQTSNKIVDQTLVQNAVNDYYNNVILSKVCLATDADLTNDRCNLVGSVTVRVNPNINTTGSFNFGILPVEANPPYTTGGAYTWQPTRPAVAIYAVYTVRIPSFFLGNTDIHVFTEAGLQEFNTPPAPGVLPWE